MNLEDHIHAMFPTESYSFATLMDDGFVQEVATRLVAEFQAADAQTQEEMIANPALPNKLTTYPAEQEEVNGRMITFPNVINLVSEDEEEIDENDFQEPPSKHPSQRKNNKDDDDDDDNNDDPQPGQGGIQKSKGIEQKGNASHSQKAPSSSPKKNHPDTQQQADQLIEEI